MNKRVAFDHVCWSTGLVIEFRIEMVVAWTAWGFVAHIVRRHARVSVMMASKWCHPMTIANFIRAVVGTVMGPASMMGAICPMAKTSTARHFKVVNENEIQIK